MLSLDAFGRVALVRVGTERHVNTLSLLETEI